MRPDEIIKTLERAGFEARYVGGCVRDTLLGRPIHDWDVTTSALPEQVLALFPRTVPTGLQHGTVTVLSDSGPVEVTTYRADGDYHDGRHPDGVRFVRSLREDTARRDFTVNAMAMDQRGNIRDFYGGRADLAAGILRCVGAPERRFREDALRMLRACRFAAQLGFAIEPETWAALLGEADADTDRIVNLIRLPRTIVTVLVGANLALAGCNLQGVLHNPLADPGIIGVSAGAGLFAMLIMLLFPEQSAMVPLAAFVGAVLSTGIVFFLAWEKGINPLRMILAGVAVATFFGGGMAALNVFYSDRIQGTVMWMAGGFQGRSWGHVEMLLPYSAIGIIGTILCARSLNALQLGDELAKSLGVRVMRMRTILIFLSALLAAVSVSVAGMLGFVGLIVPHIMRLLIGSDHEYLLPCAAIAGGAVVTLADTAARTHRRLPRRAHRPSRRYA